MGRQRKFSPERKEFLTEQAASTCFRRLFLC
jgi:hypothetical protein